MQLWFVDSGGLLLWYHKVCVCVCVFFRVTPLTLGSDLPAVESSTPIWLLTHTQISIFKVQRHTHTLMDNVPDICFALWKCYKQGHWGIQLHKETRCRELINHADNRYTTALTQDDVMTKRFVHNLTLNLLDCEQRERLSVRSIFPSSARLRLFIFCSSGRALANSSVTLSTFGDSAHAKTRAHRLATKT